jgi:DNA-binding transcriptional ArsR family regulator
MVDDSETMDLVFQALSHGVRRQMLGRLTEGDLTVGKLAEPLSVSLEAASKHVRVLERAGLVRKTIDGRRHICRFEPGPLAWATAWLRFYERFWDRRLDALEELLPQDPNLTYRRGRHERSDDS